jgi:multidrug resistance protein, MATE family
VANELGAGSARRAKFAIYNVVATSSIIGSVLFVLFLLFRGGLAYIFTDSQAVADAVAGLSPLLAFSILLNSVQPVLSGVAVGAGWQSVVAYVNITSYYLIGIPLGAVLGYALGLHVKVLHGSLSLSLSLLGCSLFTTVVRRASGSACCSERWSRLLCFSS